MNIKKHTYEDRFSRYYACNMWRVNAKNKRTNRKKFRRILKEEMTQEIDEVEEIEMTKSIIKNPDYKGDE